MRFARAAMVEPVRRAVLADRKGVGIMGESREEGPGTTFTAMRDATREDYQII